MQIGRINQLTNNVPVLICNTNKENVTHLLQQILLRLDRIERTQSYVVEHLYYLVSFQQEERLAAKYAEQAEQECYLPGFPKK